MNYKNLKINLEKLYHQKIEIKNIIEIRKKVYYEIRNAIMILLILIWVWIALNSSD